MNVLIVGSGAREHAIAKAITASASPSRLFCCGTDNNPALRALSAEFWVGDIKDCQSVCQKAREWEIDLAIIGPEAPLEKGIVDALEQQNISSVGPRQSLARIETSKSFTRDLLQKYHIPASPRFQQFRCLDGVGQFLEALGDGQYVIKADGLMGGKGVKVAGDHLHSLDAAYQYCQELHAEGLAFLIEEKLIGQEFSLLCFTDGEHSIPMPAVQDHKRAFENDAGPNTGGMGSYSDANHTLPFLTPADIETASNINNQVIKALRTECHSPYKGILYGSFIATRNGVYLIEYNARFGDPEVLNVLSIIDTDFTALCHAIATGRLAEVPVAFKPLASVCKYAVPTGYPDHPVKNQALDISRVKNQAALYLGSVAEQDGRLIACGSRAVAVVGVAANLAEAEALAEAEICRIQGDVFHRSDIGKAANIEERVAMMRELRKTETLA